MQSETLLPEQLATEIGQGCDRLGLSLDVATIDRLARLVLLLEKWNRIYSLTAVRDPRAMVTRHILDSLVVLPWLNGVTLIDVGTGAGLPGLPIAIARPDCRVTLLDSNAKKLRFVRQAASELGLDNVEVVQQRMQEYRPAQAFDMVISRAVATIADLYQQTVHLVRPGGRMLFLKGAVPSAEIESFELRERLAVEPLQVPGLDAERHLVWLDTQQEVESIQS
ncbi:MAG: 16S rRNA (guanine(527)-N(7))-methyltransferase RsmG [Thiogranum sp.]|nr:16S rRNA (guanine(527)-N(7))-methyltransferase RsmG [Thiogranum sp.]